MTKAERKQLKKNGPDCYRECVGKDGGELKQTLFIFQLKFALAHGHARFFSIAAVKLLAWLVSRGLNNLCAALRFFLVACRRMPSRA
jgi:hypothetical protein